MPENLPKDDHVIVLAIELSEVTRMNFWFDQLAENNGLDKIQAGTIKLCLNEAVINTLSYGFEKKRGGSAKITVSVEPGAVIAVVRDNGIPFNPLAVQPPEPAEDIADVQIGGLGVSIIRDFASSVDYVREGGENSLTLTFLSKVA